MIKKFKTYLLTGLFALTSFGVPLVPAGVAMASSHTTNDTKSGLCEGSELQLGAQCPIDATSGQTEVNNLVTQAINLFSFVIGIISVIMIMVGGIKYITSQGSSDNVTSAKNTILYAVVGLIVVALAQIIVRFVLGTAESIETTTT